MYHQHFKTIDSTQIYLKNNLDKLRIKDNEIIISCSLQPEGIGRRGNSWETFSNSLTMSFTISPNSTPSLTPIEIGIIVIEFLNITFGKKLRLKWPNDIMTESGKKCGGIICHYIDESIIIAGLGINLGKHETISDQQYRHGIDSVSRNLKLSENEQEKLTLELYTFILNHRISDPNILKNSFLKSCAHLDQDVFIFENDVDNIGIFRGISDLGEALVEIDSTLHTFSSSSLTIL